MADNNDLDPEKVAYWYFRLNGFLQIENFVVHPKNRGGQLTDADLLAVRFPHRAERLYDDPNDIMPDDERGLALSGELIDKLARVQLLILDDWGTHGLNDRQRLDLLEICEERYRRKSTLITAQVPVYKWHDMIGEPTIADAILDRVIHNAHRITLKGDSMRKAKTRPDLTPFTSLENNPG